MSAGLIGFLVVLALVVACVLLFRSMTRHLRKVPKSFDAPSPPPEDRKR
jgi:O-antigen ligase